MPKIPMDGKAAKRLLGYVWKGHKGQLIAVLICILVSAITGVAGSLFTQRLIDDYITPLLLFSGIHRTASGHSDDGGGLFGGNAGGIRL